MQKIILFILLIISKAFLNLSAQSSASADPMTISGIRGEFRFDGVVDDPCWKNATLLPMIMQSPVFNNPPTEKTEIMITYDNDFIYVGGRIYDRRPEKIMYTSRLRDELNPQNDWLAITFDTFNDKENGLCFATTPAGIRLDMVVINDANDVDNPVSKNWNTFWDVKTTLSDSGWFAEMRIPISSLRFQTRDSKVTMGLFAFDESNNLFYSRRIGLTEDNFPVPIVGGVRLVGRAGKYDIGLFDMQTHAFEHPDDSLKDLTSENYENIPYVQYKTIRYCFHSV